MRKLFHALNFSLLAAFVLAFIMDHNAEWKKYQKKYYQLQSEAYQKQADASKDPKEKERLSLEAKKIKRAGLEVKQIIARDLNRVDRCITCHVGMDEYTNPTLKNDFKEHPYKAHPQLDLVRAHSFQKFGCTACHEGQGLATTVADGHGKVHNWEEPILEGKRMQGACIRCHGNFETLKGAEFAALGKKLFYKHGCQGCHSIRGVGGIISVDLGAVADKPLELISGYNFGRIIGKDGKPLTKHDWTRQNWIWGHLSNDPMVVTPNDPLAQYNAEPIAPSGMPDFRKELGAEGAEAITAFLMSMSAEQLPHRYYVAGKSEPWADPKPAAGTAAHGRWVFHKYGCQGCHGLDAKEGRRNFNAAGPGQTDLVKDMDKGREPTLPDLMATYTREELKHKIQEGVKGVDVAKFNPNGPQPPLYMPPWKDKIKGQELEDLVTWLLSIAKKDDSGF
jgi:mono/diheme cytochrome c family protein